MWYWMWSTFDNGYRSDVIMDKIANWNQPVQDENRECSYGNYSYTEIKLIAKNIRQYISDTLKYERYRSNIPHQYKTDVVLHEVKGNFNYRII